MERTTISLPDETVARLRVVAAERRTSMAQLVREAVEEALERHRPAPKSFGLGASGRSDTARATSDEPIAPPSWR